MKATNPFLWLVLLTLLTACANDQSARQESAVRDLSAAELNDGTVIIRPELCRDDSAEPDTYEIYQHLQEIEYTDPIEEFEEHMRREIENRAKLRHGITWPRIPSPDPRRTREQLHQYFTARRATVRPGRKVSVSTYDFWTGQPDVYEYSDEEEDSLVYIYVDGHEICIESYELNEGESSQIVEEDALGPPWYVRKRIRISKPGDPPEFHEFCAKMYADVVLIHRG